MGGGKQPVNSFSLMTRKWYHNLRKYGHRVKRYIGLVKFRAALGGFLWIEKSDA